MSRSAVYDQVGSDVDHGAEWVKHVADPLSVSTKRRVNHNEQRADLSLLADGAVVRCSVKYEQQVVVSGYSATVLPLEAVVAETFSRRDTLSSTRAVVQLAAVCLLAVVQRPPRVTGTLGQTRTTSMPCNRLRNNYNTHLSMANVKAVQKALFSDEIYVLDTESYVIRFATSTGV